jgi:uncharacterized protein with von Willebrand factor type A (vWA) domain
MFVDFFYHLRSRGLKVSLTEFLTLLQALHKGHSDANLNRFYTLARSILVKRPEHYDIYDMAFAEYFKDATWDPSVLGELTDELMDWLNDPIEKRELSPEELAMLEAMDLDELRQQFLERLDEQDERHDGGDRWVGTGGTSPFGHGGTNPAGIRVGGEGGGRSAVQVAMDRRFKNLRDDLTLDVRQFQSALRRLRILSREEGLEELDLDETIDATARNAGDIELVFRRPRKNRVKLLLLTDVGGSMNVYARITSLLFSAAHQATHFKEFKSYYFHNCVYGKLYTNMQRRETIATQEVLDNIDSSWRVIFVGDAAMAPYELMDSGGAIDYYYMNPKPGIHWLRRFKEVVPRAVWLNPDPIRYWSSTYTCVQIRNIFPMFSLTLEGLDDAIRELRSKPA